MNTPWRKTGHHYVSPFNFAAEITRGIALKPGEKVQFYDSTIRKAMLVPGGKLPPENQVCIAEALQDAGVGGLFYNYFYDRRILKSLEKAQENQLGSTAVCRAVPKMRKVACLYAFPKGFRMEDACELALEAGMDVLEPGIPASDVEREADVPGTSREKLIDSMVKCIEYCKSLGKPAAANFTDCGRADPDHVADMINAAVDAGVTDVRLTDSYSSMSPEGTRYLIRMLKEKMRRSVPMMIHIHDDYGLATAATVSAALEGVHADTTVNGFGDKGGFAATEEVAVALEFLYGVPTTIKLDRLKALSDLVVEMTGIPREPIKAVVGTDIFHVEADAAVARLLREDITIDDPGARVVARTYEPSLVGRSRTKVWGRTTLDGAAIREKMKSMRLSFADEHVLRVSREIERRLGTRRNYPCWLEESEVEGICRELTR
jgi:isopropylmalate/homocitrate/citramalate synthase